MTPLTFPLGSANALALKPQYTIPKFSHMVDMYDKINNFLTDIYIQELIVIFYEKYYLV